MPGSIGSPSTSSQALMAARELLLAFPPLTIALVKLYVHNAASIERVAEMAPPFDVFTADGTSKSVTTGPKPAPLMAPSVTSFTLFAKNALFDAGFCADMW